jgi:hypothetical protein
MHHDVVRWMESKRMAQSRQETSAASGHLKTDGGTLGFNQRNYDYPSRIGAHGKT